MKSLLDHIEFVNAEAVYHQRRADFLKKQSPKEAKPIEKHQKLVASYSQLAADLAVAQVKLDEFVVAPPEFVRTSHLIAALPDVDGARAILDNPLSIMPEHLLGLPQELIEQLNISETDKFEANVIHLVNAAGGTMLLDLILIGLYHMTKETHQRQQFANKLYRMTRKGTLYSVPGKKGLYTTTEPEDDAEGLNVIQKVQKDIEDLVNNSEQK